MNLKSDNLTHGMTVLFVFVFSENQEELDNEESEYDVALLGTDTPNKSAVVDTVPSLSHQSVDQIPGFTTPRRSPLKRNNTPIQGSVVCLPKNLLNKFVGQDKDGDDIASTQKQNEETAAPNPLHAVVIRRPGVRGVFGSPRRQFPQSPSRHRHPSNSSISQQSKPTADTNKDVNKDKGEMVDDQKMNLPRRINLKEGEKVDNQEINLPKGISLSQDSALSPSKSCRSQQVQERCMIFRDSPIASLQCVFNKSNTGGKKERIGLKRCASLPATFPGSADRGFEDNRQALFSVKEENKSIKNDSFCKNQNNNQGLKDCRMLKDKPRKSLREEFELLSNNANKMPLKPVDDANIVVEKPVRRSLRSAFGSVSPKKNSGSDTHLLDKNKHIKDFDERNDDQKLSKGSEKITSAKENLKLKSKTNTKIEVKTYSEESKDISKTNSKSDQKESEVSNRKTDSKMSQNKCSKVSSGPGHKVFSSENKASSNTTKIQYNESNEKIKGTSEKNQKLRSFEEKKTFKIENENDEEKILLNSEK